MTELLVVIVLGLLIGAVLGGLGGGGAILTVPALVYLVGQSGQEATAGSLVIVALTALVGTASYVRGGRVRWAVGVAFGVIGIPATWLGSVLSRRVAEDVLLLGFSALMLVAALAMVSGVLRRQEENEPSRGIEGHAPQPGRPGAGPTGGLLLQVAAPPAAVEVGVRPPLVTTALVATAAGLLTGFFGVGGGFVIVPALVLALRLPMRQAVGTSLVVVALNSVTALASRSTELHLDLAVIAPFAVAAMVATLLGKRVADRLPARRLQVAFAMLMVLIAGYTAWQSLTAG